MRPPRLVVFSLFITSRELEKFFNGIPFCYFCPLKNILFSAYFFLINLHPEGFMFFFFLTFLSFSSLLERHERAQIVVSFGMRPCDFLTFLNYNRL